MPLVGSKVTLFFDQQGYGWTESYYTATVIASGSSTGILTNTLLTARLKCCGQQTSVSFIRVIDLSGKRLGFTYRPTAAGSGKSGVNSDAPATAANIRRFDNSNRRQAAWYMRGNWDDACDLGGVLNPASLWFTQALQPFLGVLVSDAWCWLAKDLASPLPSPVATITSNASGQLIITTAQPVFTAQAGPLPPWGYKVRVSVSGVVGADTANGVWVVTVQSATQCTTVRQILINPYASGTGRLTYNQPALFQIADARFMRFVERKPGRPLFHSVGKSKRRRVTW